MREPGKKKITYLLKAYNLEALSKITISCKSSDFYLEQMWVPTYAN